MTDKNTEWEDVPAGGGWEDVEQEKPTMGQRTARVGREALVGGITGAVAPEIMQKAGSAIRTAGQAMGPYGRIPTAIGSALQAGGQAMTVARPASFFAGTLGGATGETAGQIAESKVGPGLTAETSRLLGATLGPVPFQLLGTKVGGALGTLAGKVIPGMSTAKTVGQLLQEAEVKPSKLTSEQRAFIERKLEDIRKGQPSLDAQKEIMDMLKRGAQRVTQTAEQQAAQLEQQAKSIVDEAERAGGVISADMEKRIANLRSQFDSAAEKLRADATSQARDAVSSASKRAALIRKNAQGQSASVREIAEIEAKDAVQKAQKQADDLIKNSERQIAEAQSRFENQQKRLSKFQKTSETFREKQVSQLGERILPTDLGKQVRTLFDNTLNTIKTNRDTVTKELRQAWKSAISKKEAAGQDYRNTKAYQEEKANIESLLFNKDTQMLMQTDEKVKSAINSVLKAINPVKRGVTETGQAFENPQKASVDALEVIYRRLRDRASGLPAEGVEAIDQQLAGKLAKPLERIIDEFSEGSYSAFKNAWREASKPLNEFRTKTGKFVTDKPEGFDLGDYMERLSGIGGQVFQNESTARQLLSVAGPDEAKRLAQGFLVDQIGEATPSKIKSVLEANRDWLKLNEFKALRDKFESIATGVAKAKTQEERAQILQKALGVRIERLPSAPVKEAARIEKAGETQAQRIQREAQQRLGEIEKEAGAKMERFGEPSTERLRAEAEQQIAAGAPKVEAQAGEMRRTAEQQAKELAKTAEKEAGTLTKEAGDIRSRASDLAKLITSGDKSGPARIRDLILGENEKELTEAAKIIMASPGGKEKFADAVNQVLADRIGPQGQGLGGAIKDWRYIGDRLKSAGLMSDKQVSDIANKLQEVFVAPIDLKQKITWAQRLIRNAISGYAGPGVSRVVEEVVK